MNNGLPIGLIEYRINPLEGTKALFDRELPDPKACERFIQSFNRKQQHRLVRLNNAVHTAIFAPTGVGKGVSLIIPFLQTCDEPCVVIDPKGENASITGETRRKMGHRVVILDPFDMVGGTDRLNPVEFIGRADDPYALDDCASLAQSMVLRSGEERERHWNDSAEFWIKAMLGLVASEGEDDRSLQTIRPLLTITDKIAAAIRLIQASSAWGGMLSRLGHQLTHARDRELGSVLTTVNRHCTWLDTPAVAKNTSASTFNPSDLCDKKMTVYLVLPPRYQESHAPMVRMWLDTLMRAVVKGGLSNRRVHFVIDEAASLGHMVQLENAVDKYRGYGIRCQFYYQSIGQLRKCWPNGQDQTLLSNVTRIFFGVNDIQTAEQVSKELGKSTIINRSGGTSTGVTRQQSPKGEGGGSTSSNTSDNWSPTGRELLQPSEVLQSHPRLAFTFAPGLPPICTWLSRYYESQESTKMGNSRMIVDTFCLFLTALMLAAMCTGNLIKQTFR